MLHLFTRHDTTYILEGRGYEICAAEGGQQALRLFSRKDTFDLVLRDYHMAVMNGGELLKNIKHRYPDALVILMTACATVESAVSAMKAGLTGSATEN